MRHAMAPTPIPPMAISSRHPIRHCFNLMVTTTGTLVAAVDRQRLAAQRDPEGKADIRGGNTDEQGVSLFAS